MSETMNNIDELFGMDILNETVIEESTIPKTDEGTGTPKLQETFPEVKIPVPGKTELTASVYNDALAKLKNLMKESAEIMQTLVDVEIVQESVEVLQERFTEDAIENALFESYISGPMFEAAGNPDKKEIRKAINGIFKAAPKWDKDDYSLRVFGSVAKQIALSAASAAVGSTIGSLIAAAILAPGTGMTKKDIAKTIATGAAESMVIGGGIGALIAVRGRQYVRSLRENKDFTTKFWQMIGCFNVPEDKLNDALKHYTEMYKDQIGDLTFNAVKLKVKESKQVGFCYLLILDSNKEKIKDIEIDVEEDKK